MVLDSFFDAILGNLVGSNPKLALVVISFAIAMFTTLAYKYFSNQDELKKIKEDVKSMQAEAKEHKDDQKKAMEINKQIMQRNMESFKHNIKPMVITFLPIILIFGWLSANLAYEPLGPGEQFEFHANFYDLTGMASLSSESVAVIGESEQEIKDEAISWILEAPDDPGQYTLDLEYKDVVYTHDILISEEQKYLNPEQKIEKEGLKSVGVSQDKLKLFFGFGWLGSYILLSIVFSIALKKILKVH